MRAKVLDAVKFMHVLVSVAVMRYVVEGTTNDVSDAVDMLFNADILPNLDADALREPNAFRRLMYCEDVDRELKRRERSLRLIFSTLSVRRGPNKKLLTFEAWRLLLRKVGLAWSECG